jgi:hypothetical protein
MPPDPPAKFVGPQPDPNAQLAVEERELVEVYRIEPKPIRVEPSAPSREKVAEQPRAPLSGLSDYGPHEWPAVEAREAVEESPLEQRPIDAEPAQAPQAIEAREVAATQPGPLPDRRRPVPEVTAVGTAPVGRWEEFHEPREPESARGSRAHLELVPLRQGAPSRLLTADLEREPRSSFMTLVVPTIAALLVVGALLWSGYRVRRQDAAVSTLQKQNQKLTEMLAEMGEELKTPIPSSSNADAIGASQQTATSATKPSRSEQAATPPGEESKVAGQSGTRQVETGKPETGKPGKGKRENRQGVSAPPPIQQRGRVSARQVGSLYDHPPEIVPPYPTIYKTENAAANAANSQPVPNAGTYHEPFVPGAPRQTVPAPVSKPPATSTSTTPRASVPQPSAATRTPAPLVSNTNNIAPASTSYDAASNDAGIGSHASMLAQNVEAVQGLQRHSPVQLREFHARAGTPTLATPNVRLSVEHPDQGSGSYALVINQGGSSQQFRGAVNQPLAFTDTTTHRGYALVVLSIANQQVYGYLRAAQ